MEGTVDVKGHFCAIQHRIDLLQEGFYSFPEGTPCPDALCPYNTRCQHFHCSQPRCFYVTDREDILIMHSKDFHDNIDIMDGFLFFDRTVDCRLPSCHRCVVPRLMWQLFLSLCYDQSSWSWSSSFLYFPLFHLQVQPKDVEIVIMCNTMYLLNHRCQMTQDSYNTMIVQ